MGYLVRKADAFLREWKKNPDRKPLIIKGARQVGKTETIRTFARENYKNVIEINFITEPSYKVIVEEGFSAEHIIKLISRIDPTKHFEENETLIFFDEIQDFPEIATALKFFKENGKYDVICSGSLLGVQYQRIASISVGYKTDYQMYSMDFEEFLWAKGYSEEAISDMLCHMLEGVAFSEAEQMIFSTLFLEYSILGGMPAIVSSYIERETFEGSLDLQHQLLVDYENDIVKYAQGLDKAKILSVYSLSGTSDSIFPEVVRIAQINASFLFLILFSPSLCCFGTHSVKAGSLHVHVDDAYRHTFYIQVGPDGSVVGIRKFYCL